MIITTHAKKRLKQRLGLPKKALEKNVQEAYDKGRSHSDCKGRLKKYLDFLYLSHGTCNNTRVWNNMCYMFKGKTLITVIHLPPRLRTK